jgi:hypothetical protein
MCCMCACTVPTNLCPLWLEGPGKARGVMFCSVVAATGLDEAQVATAVVKAMGVDLIVVGTCTFCSGCCSAD